MVRYQDNSSRFLGDLEVKATTAILDVAKAAAKESRRRMGTEGGGPFVPRVSKFTGKVWYEGVGAEVGSFPAVRSGKLRDTIDARKSRRGATFGSPVGHAAHTNLRNPFLAPVLRYFKLQGVFTRGMRRGSTRISIRR